MGEQSEFPIMELFRFLMAAATVVVILRMLGPGWMTGFASMAGTQLKTKVSAMAAGVGEMIGARI